MLSGLDYLGNAVVMDTNKYESERHCVSAGNLLHIHCITLWQEGGSDPSGLLSLVIAERAPHYGFLRGWLQGPEEDKCLGNRGRYGYKWRWGVCLLLELLKNDGGNLHFLDLELP